MFLFGKRLELSIRQIQPNQLPQARELIETSRHTHLQLDWWTLEDWTGNPGFLVAERGKQLVGLGLGVRDASTVAWLRALVAEDGLNTGALLAALLPPMLAALRSQGVRALNCMAWPDWLAEKLPEHGFAPATKVVTLRKDELNIPLDLTSNATLREANSTDLGDVTVIDHAAFEEDWWYGQTTFFRAMHGASRFVMAEQNGLPVGYAFAHQSGSHAHVTRLAVLPSHQRQGIGALLMADLIEHSRSHGADTLTLNTQTYNQNSLRLYHRLGFMDTDTVVTAFSRPVG